MAVAIPGKYYSLFEQASKQYGVPLELLMGLAHIESGFNPSAIGPMTPYGRAKGMMQFLDSTAKQYGINALDPAQAIPAAAKYLQKEYKHFGDWGKAVTAYHSGRGNVEKGTLGPNGRAYGPAVFKAAGMEFKPFYPNPSSTTITSASDTTVQAPLGQTSDTMVPKQPIAQPLTPEQQQSPLSWTSSNSLISPIVYQSLAQSGLFNNNPLFAHAFRMLV